MDSYDASYWLVTILSFFFFNDTATTEIYTLSLHDALPIWPPKARTSRPSSRPTGTHAKRTSSSSGVSAHSDASRSEEHTSELQSHLNLVCRLLLEKKKKQCSQNLRLL